MAVDKETDPGQGLDALSVREVLDADSRPTFIIDLDPDDPSCHGTKTIAPVFCNAALRLHERLLDAVLGSPNSTTAPTAAAEDSPSHNDFKQWVTCLTPHNDSKDVFPLPFTFENLFWTGSTVQGRWKIISGNRLWRLQHEPSLDLASGAPASVTGASNKSFAKMSRVDTHTEDHPATQNDSNYELPSPTLYTTQSQSAASVRTGDPRSSKNISINLDTLPERAVINWTLANPGGLISFKTCHFEGALGVPEGHVATPEQLGLRRNLEGFVPSFQEATRTREPILLRVKDGTLPEALLEGIEWRDFGDPCSEAIIFPVRPTTTDNVLAFLVLGVNPRRPYDNEYKAFASMFNRQMATSLAPTTLLEEETKRIRNAIEAAYLEKGKQFSPLYHMHALLVVATLPFNISGTISLLFLTLSISNAYKSLT